MSGVGNNTRAHEQQGGSRQDHNHRHSTGARKRPSLRGRAVRAGVVGHFPWMLLYGRLGGHRLSCYAL